MPSADKRARKKENARAAREEREAAIKRKKRTRSMVTMGIVTAVFIGFVAILTVTNGDDKKEATPTTKNGCSTKVPPKGETQTFSKPELPEFDATKTYTATIATSCGTFKVALDTKQTPKGAGNFVFLAEKGFYDGTIWSRAASDFVIQGGDPNGDNTGGPGYTTQAETTKSFELGTIGYAKTDADPPGAAGSQFFVVTGSNTGPLNQKVGDAIPYAAFGQVSSGLDVAQKIMGFAPPEGDGPPTQDVYIDKVTISTSDQPAGTTTSSTPSSTSAPSTSTSTTAPAR